MAGMAIAGVALTSAQHGEPRSGPLDEHPGIQYALRPTTDRVTALNQSLDNAGLGDIGLETGAIEQTRKNLPTLLGTAALFG